MAGRVSVMRRGGGLGESATPRTIRCFSLTAGVCGNSELI